MDRTVITQAVEDFTDPDIRRYSSLMADYWVRLRLCLTSATGAKLQRKRDEIIRQTATIDTLKKDICEFALSSQEDILLAMACEANRASKKRGRWWTQIECAYHYKCLLINVLVLLFEERHNVAFEQSVVNPKPITLVVGVNKENGYVLDLRFFMGYTFGMDARGQLRKAPSQEIPIGFHIPINHLIKEVKSIFKPVL